MTDYTSWYTTAFPLSTKQNAACRSPDYQNSTLHPKAENFLLFDSKGTDTYNRASGLPWKWNKCF